MFFYFYYYFRYDEEEGVYSEFIPIGKPNYGISFSDILPPKLKNTKVIDQNTEIIQDMKNGEFVENDRKSKKKKSIRRRVSFDGTDAETENQKEEKLEGNNFISNMENNDNDNDNLSTNEITMNTNNNNTILIQTLEEIEIENIKKKIKETKESNKITELAFQRKEFKELASEILRNTFYNLLLESVHGDYSLMANSVKYVLKE